MTHRVAVFTIVSKNYLAYARTLMKSIARYCPEWDRYVCLADRVDGYFDPATENFKLVTAEELKIPDFRKFAFRYNILEFNTAVKPFMIEWLMSQQDDVSIVYLDPDIQVFSPFIKLERLLGEGALAVITPHITDQIRDHKSPAEREFLRAGVYNLGFIALGVHPQRKDFVNWWCRHLERDCVMDLANGLHVDQKWIDLAPALFDGVSILRDPAYNVAYWNLMHRTIEERKSKIYVNGHPLVFFHFSGINPRDERIFSKHQNRFSMESAGIAGVLAKKYIRALRENGFDTCIRWPYAYSGFKCGVEVPDAGRKLYRENAAVAEAVGDDPFAANFDIFNQPVTRDDGPPITQLMYEIWKGRPDLKSAFSDIFVTHRRAFVDWFRESAKTECCLDDHFIPAMHRSEGNNFSPARRLAAYHRYPQALIRYFYMLALRSRPLARRFFPAAARARVRNWLLAKSYQQQHKTRS